MSQGIEFLNTLAHNLRHQDNAYTSYPIYEVQEQRQITGIDPDYTEDVLWISPDCEIVGNDEDCDEYTVDALNRMHDDGEDAPDGYRRTGFIHQWHHAASFLTLSAAEDYIKANGHRHEGELRVYVESAYRNPEWKELRRLLSGPVQDCICALQAMLDEDDGGMESVKARAALSSLDAYKDPCA